MTEEIHLNDSIYLTLINRGKVRDVYSVNGVTGGENQLLVIKATDRISAFDVRFEDEIKGKGAILNSLTNFWLEKTKHIIPNHTASVTDAALSLSNLKDKLGDGVSVVKRLKPLPIEAVVRGYITGSGWKEYQKTGSISGVELKKGLEKNEKLDHPIYTPTTKVAEGHDESVSYGDTEASLGKNTASLVRDKALELYEFGHNYALEKGIIIADTKFEFGTDEDGKLYLIDEVMTPDSSRFWVLENYKSGGNADSIDKQIMRDWLEEINWNKTPPAPSLPTDLKNKILVNYQRAFDILMG